MDAAEAADDQVKEETSESDRKVTAVSIKREEDESALLITIGDEEDENDKRPIEVITLDDD